MIKKEILGFRFEFDKRSPSMHELSLSWPDGFHLLSAVNQCITKPTVVHLPVAYSGVYSRIGMKNNGFRRKVTGKTNHFVVVVVVA